MSIANAPSGKSKKNVADTYGGITHGETLHYVNSEFLIKGNPRNYQWVGINKDQ